MILRNYNIKDLYISNFCKMENQTKYFKPGSKLNVNQEDQNEILNLSKPKHIRKDSLTLNSKSSQDLLLREKLNDFGNDSLNTQEITPPESDQIIEKDGVNNFKENIKFIHLSTQSEKNGKKSCNNVFVQTNINESIANPKTGSEKLEKTYNKKNLDKINSDSKTILSIEDEKAKDMGDDRTKNSLIMEDGRTTNVLNIKDEGTKNVLDIEAERTKDVLNVEDQRIKNILNIDKKNELNVVDEGTTNIPNMGENRSKNVLDMEDEKSKKVLHMEESPKNVYSEKSEPNNNKVDNGTNDHLTLDDNIKDNRNRYMRQMLFMLITSSCHFVLGFVIGWSAILPKMEDDQNLGFSIQNSDVRWLVSCIYIPAIIGNMLGGTLGEKFGPKKCLLVIMPIAAACWCALALSYSLITLYIFRILLGLVYGLINTLVQPLVTEMSETKIRGIANFLPEIMGSFSIMLAYIVAHVFPWRISCAFCGAVLVPVLIMLFFVPESPYWLLRHDDPSGCEKSLIKLFGLKNIDLIQKSIKDIQTSITNQKQNTIKDQIKLLKYARNWKPLVLLSSIICLREASGKVSVFMYAVYIFKSADVTLDPFICTILVGSLRLISTIIGTFMINKIGRKPLLATTVLICGCSLATAGGILLTEQTFPGAKLIVLGCVLLFVISYSLGVSPIPWALMGELLPTPVRSLSTSVVCVCFSGSIFVMTNIFPMMLNELGLGLSFIIFSIFNFLFAVIVSVFLPETRGRNLLELENAFS